MGKQTINIGTTANDGTGDAIRTAFDKVNDNFDEIYSTGFMSRFDATTRPIYESILNIMYITGTPEQNGGLALMDSNSWLTPLGLNDVLILDFAGTFITPAGSDHYATISLYVPSAGNYRSQTIPLIKGSGNDDEFSVSWTLPVGATFLANGGYVVIDADVDLSIKNRYINVTQIRKGV